MGVIKIFLILAVSLYFVLSLITCHEFYANICEKYREQKRLARHFIEDYDCRALEVIATLLRKRDAKFHSFLHTHREGKNWYSIMKEHLDEVDDTMHAEEHDHRFIELATTVAHLYSVNALDDCKENLRIDKMDVDQKAVHEVASLIRNKMEGLLQISDTNLFIFRLTVTNLMANAFFFYVTLIIISLIILLVVWKTSCPQSQRVNRKKSAVGSDTELELDSGPDSDDECGLHEPPPYLHDMSSMYIESNWFQSKTKKA